MSGLVGWLFTSHGIETPQNIAGVLQAVVETVMVMFAGYVLTHIPINKFVNPGDAASSHLAAAEKRQVVQMKADDVRNG